MGMYPMIEDERNDRLAALRNEGLTDVEAEERYEREKEEKSLVAHSPD
jgi:hypothetical protein